jgi:hypothetical protein
MGRGQRGRGGRRGGRGGQRGGGRAPTGYVLAPSGDTSLITLRADLEFFEKLAEKGAPLLRGILHVLMWAQCGWQPGVRSDLVHFAPCSLPSRCHSGY